MEVGFSMKPKDSEVVLGAIRKPEYPAKARSEKMSGRIVFEFTVNTMGDPVDIKLMESTPDGIFEPSAREVLVKARFAAKTVDGQRVESSGNLKRIDYVYEKQSIYLVTGETKLSFPLND